VGKETINHPEHYFGDTPYEVIKVIHEWRLDEDFDLANCVKYIARSGLKGDTLEDLKKAAFYLNYRIEMLDGTRER
jgi:hypothetical protein